MSVSCTFVNDNEYLLCTCMNMNEQLIVMCIVVFSCILKINVYEYEWTLINYNCFQWGAMGLMPIPAKTVNVHDFIWKNYQNSTFYSNFMQISDKMRKLQAKMCE